MPAKRKSGRLRVTFKQSRLIELFLAPTKDQGVSIGFTEASFRNVRLTIFYNSRDQRLHTHISDPASKRFPWSQQIDPDFFDDVYKRLTKSWSVPFDKIPHVYMMRARLARKVASLAPKSVSDQTTELPYEAYGSRLRLDFRNSDRWRRIASRELSVTPPGYGYALAGGIVKIVRPSPTTEGQLLCYSELQASRVETKLSRLLGLEMFGEYIETRKVGEAHLNVIRSRLKHSD